MWVRGEVSSLAEYVVRTRTFAGGVSMSLTDGSTRIEKQIADRALDYVLHPPTGSDPVVDFAAPGDLLAVFDEAVSIDMADVVQPAPDSALMEAVELVLKHSMHTSHPRFLNQNFAGPDPVSVVGDWLGAALNTTGATFEAAPVFTLIENALLKKLGRVAGYRVDDEPSAIPPGLFCPGGSTATLYALQLARHRHQPDVVRVGAGPDRLVLFVSDAGHYAAVKSAALLGLGMDAVMKVASDPSGAMNTEALSAAVEHAQARGLTPFAVIATAGTTVTSAFDDINEVADICEAHGLWLHVDGCYGGSALFSPSQRHRLAGVERSDSFVWNLHKMMGMTQQCSALLVRDPHQLAPCFATGADYLFQPDKAHGEYDSGDRTFQCARRVDSLKLWLAWNHHGDAGFADRIDHAVAMADHARDVIRRSGGEFVQVVDGSFSNVVFAWVPEDLRPLASLDALDDSARDRMHLLPPAIKRHMQAEGTAMLGFQPIGGCNTFRLICMSSTVQTDDIDAVYRLISTYGGNVTSL